MLVSASAVRILPEVVNIYWVLTPCQGQTSGIANSGPWNGRASKATEGPGSGSKGDSNRSAP